MSLDYAYCRESLPLLLAAFNRTMNIIVNYISVLG